MIKVDASCVQYKNLKPKPSPPPHDAHITRALITGPEPPLYAGGCKEKDGKCFLFPTPLMILFREVGA